MKKRARRCSGIDVHKEKVMVCVLPPKGAEGTRIDREFSTYTAGVCILLKQRFQRTDIRVHSFLHHMSLQGALFLFATKQSPYEVEIASSGRTPSSQ